MQNPFRAIGKLKLRHAIYMATETSRNDGGDGDEEHKQEDIRKRKRKGKIWGNVRKITERETEARSISDTKSNATRSVGRDRNARVEMLISEYSCAVVVRFEWYK